MRVQLAELQEAGEKQRELARLQRRHDHEYGPGCGSRVERGGSVAIGDAPISGQRVGMAQPRAIALWPGEVNLCAVG